MRSQKYLKIFSLNNIYNEDPLLPLTGGGGGVYVSSDSTFTWGGSLVGNTVATGATGAQLYNAGTAALCGDFASEAGDLVVDPNIGVTKIKTSCE